MALSSDLDQIEPTITALLTLHYRSMLPAIKREGLSTSQFFTLMALAERGRMRLGALADALGLTVYAVSLREVDTLGLIKSSSGTIEGGPEVERPQAA